MLRNLTADPQSRAPARYELLETYYPLAESVIKVAKLFFDVLNNDINEDYWQGVSTKTRKAIRNRLGILEKVNLSSHPLWNESHRFTGIDELRKKCLTKKKVFHDNSHSDNAKTEASPSLAIASAVNNESKFSFKLTSVSTATPSVFSSIQRIESFDFLSLRKKLESRFRSRDKLRTLQIEFMQELGSQEIQVMKEYLRRKNALALTSDKRIFAIQFIGEDVNKYTRKNGYLETLQKRINQNLISHQSQKPILFAGSYPSVFDEISSSLAKIMKFGFLPSCEIKRYIVRGLKNQADIPAAKKLISKLRTKTKRETRKHKLKNTLSSVIGFDGENLYKGEVILGQRPLIFYYSEKIVQFIREGVFDLVFVDSTHIKSLRKSQVTLVRFYSSESSKVLTALYALSPSKKAEAYTRIFKLLDELGLLINCRFLTTDFELAIRKGCEQAIKNPITFRFCFYHLIAATRRYASSINRTISLENQLKKRVHRPTLPHIFRIFSFLVFVPKPLQKLLFKAFRFVIRFHQNSLANEMFIAYFNSTYISGPLSRHFFLDLNDTHIITNNFVEGVNSSLKRHNRGRVNTDTFLDWMQLDVKQSIMNFNDSSKKTLTTNLKFKEFQERINHQTDFVRILLEYIDGVSKTVRSENEFSILNARSEEFRSFASFFSSITINWNEHTIFVYHNDQLIYSTTIGQEENHSEIELWAQIEPEFPTYFKRLKHK